jgi:FkbM family methyltransferase
VPTAPSSRFRDAGPLEALGDWLRFLPLGRGTRTWLKHLHHSALMIRTGGRGLASKFPGGETVYVTPTYRCLSWNPVEYAAFRGAVRPGAIVLDVGANAGAYSLLLGQWTGPTGRVYAFEPAPLEFDGLVRHVALNGMTAIVEPVRAAVSDTLARARFVAGEGAGQGRLAAEADAHAQAVTVSVTTIDAFCAREHIVPAFIKIDVEGSEIAVLRGARDTLRRQRGRVSVFMELHPGTWPYIGTSREALEDELRAQDLTLEPLAPMEDWFAVEGMCLRVVPR